MTFTENIHRALRRMTPALWLVTLSAGVFVILHLTAAVMRFTASETGMESVVEWLTLPSGTAIWLSRPWTALTYMFVHYDPLHIIVNALWIYMFAAMASDLVPSRGIFAIYIAGGLTGAAFYLAACTAGAGTASSGLVGASAAALALMTFVIIRQPSRKVMLPVFGEASLKIIGLIALILLFFGADSTCSHAAHAGGIAAGVAAAVIAVRMKNRKTAPVFSSRPQQTPPQRRFTPTDITTHIRRTDTLAAGENAAGPSLDDLLDKIRRSGYGSLSAAERDALFKISTDLQNNRQ